jgi:hypothetical protein
VGEEEVMIEKRVIAKTIEALQAVRRLANYAYWEHHQHCGSDFHDECAGNCKHDNFCIQDNEMELAIQDLELEIEDQ